MTLLHNTADFTLDSWHNGLSYELCERRTGRIVFVQGDEASTFSDELENLEAAFPDMPTNDVLYRLWGLYENIAGY